MLIKQKTSQHGHMGDDDGYWRGACNKRSSRFIWEINVVGPNIKRDLNWNKKKKLNSSSSGKI